MQPIPPTNARVGLPMSDTLKAAWPTPTTSRWKTTPRSNSSITNSPTETVRAIWRLNKGSQSEYMGLAGFCRDTLSGEAVPRCFGGDITYLNWLMSAWGWTLSVALLALVVALVVGSLVGIARTTPVGLW